MYNSHHFYILILLFLFAFLLTFFNSYIDHYRFIDYITWLLVVVPVLGFIYLSKFRDADIEPFYVFFSVLLAMYILIFAGTTLYSIFSPDA